MMTSTDIRVGDRVTRRDSTRPGRVAALLSAHGGFGDAPWLTDEHTPLLSLASVSWQGVRRFALERTDDLVKDDADRA